MLNRQIPLALLLVLTACAAPKDPAPMPGVWWKGNLHTHSLWSDGNDFPEMIAAWYKDHGYHFLALSDHNVLSDGQRWLPVAAIAQRGAAAAIERARQRFGRDWVETRERDGQTEVRLRRLDEVRPLVEEPGRFLMIQAEEITDRALGRLPIHINASNLAELIRPQGGRNVQDVIRRNLVAVEAQREAIGRPILAHLNHPNFGWGVTAEDLAHVTEERFFEVYNGHAGVRHLGDDLHASVERLWDIANTIRIVELGAPPLFGLATDDSHHYFGQTVASPGRGWVMVRAARLDATAVVEAIERGDFYASSGVTLRAVRLQDGVLEIEIEPDGDARFETRFVGTRRGVDLTGQRVEDERGNPVRATRRYSASIGETFAVVAGLRARYRLRGDELYVRAVVTSSRPHPNASFEGQAQQAWTQPVGWCR